MGMAGSLETLVHVYLTIPDGVIGIFH